MTLNPGLLTFRGAPGSPGSAGVTTFDETLRTAELRRERGIKPQVFLYHLGHLDIVDYLIQRDALDKPYFVQMVFGQQSGIPTSMDSVLYMVRNLPDDCIFQTCALGLEEIHVNFIAILLGGHVRTGMEDSVLYQRDELAQGNVQLVERIVLALPLIPKAVGSYQPVGIVNNLAFVAGQPPLDGDKRPYLGRLGAELTLEQGQAAARLSLLNILG